MKYAIKDYSEIAHLWANELQDHAYYSGRMNRMYFRDKTIFSYGDHFPIATIHQEKGKDKIVLFTNRKYSNTTAGHCATVRAACSQYERIYCYNPLDAHNGIHRENLEQWERQIKAVIPSLENARKPEKYLGQIAYMRESAKKYAEYFGLDLARYVWLDIESKDDISKAIEKESALLKADMRARKQRESRLLKKSIKEFRSFESAYVHRSEYSYLRFNPQSERIETSQRVEIPFTTAKRFWEVIKGVTTGAMAFVPGNKLLEYPITEITKERIRVGCHLIAMDEIQAMANQLGWN